MKTLNVKETNEQEISKKWGFPICKIPTRMFFIRCNAKGEVNWEKASLYTLEELVKRGNVNIL